jgi:hypothetical protein
VDRCYKEYLCRTAERSQMRGIYMFVNGCLFYAHSNLFDFKCFAISGNVERPRDRGSMRCALSNVQLWCKVLLYFNRQRRMVKVWSAVVLCVGIGTKYGTGLLCIRMECDHYEFEILHHENLGLILCIRKVSGPISVRTQGVVTGFRGVPQPLQTKHLSSIK